MIISKTFQLLLWPLSYSLQKLHRLDEIKKETIRVINDLLQKATYDARDYGIDFKCFDGFSVYHRKTGTILAYIYTKQCFVEYKNLPVQSKLFPAAFASEHSQALEFSESLYFWYEDGKASSIVAEISADQIGTSRYYGIGAECPFHNTIKIIMNGDLDIKKITKEVWDASEMYGYTIEDKEYPPSTPLDQIFSISNKLLNDKVSPEKN